MIRAVLDTNVVVSAFIRATGTPGAVLELLVAERFVLILSPALLSELRETLLRPRVRKYLKLARAVLEAQLISLELLAEPVPGTTALDAELRDADDLIVLVAAIEGRADYVVTGDDDLLTLGSFHGVEIVTPRAFLEVLQRG